MTCGSFQQTWHPATKSMNKTVLIQLLHLSTCSTVGNKEFKNTEIYFVSKNERTLKNYIFRFFFKERDFHFCQALTGSWVQEL